METKIITRVNNVDIVATSDEQLVPIRPICDALGIDAKVQRQKIQEDEDLSSTGVLSTSVGADGKGQGDGAGIRELSELPELPKEKHYQKGERKHTEEQ